MSELKSYKMVDEDYCDNALCVIPSDVYLKPEADEVIAELQKQVHDYAQGLYEIQARAENEIRRQKYKRCLAMARYCRSVWSAIIFIHEGSGAEHYMKWEQRWLEFANKFKEGK